MSDSVRPHRQQPTRLCRPWDSPGKNTGVGCHFLLQCMKVKSESEVAQSCLTSSDPKDCSLPSSSVHEIFLGKSTGVAYHCLLRHLPHQPIKWESQITALQSNIKLNTCVDVSRFLFFFTTSKAIAMIKILIVSVTSWEIDGETVKIVSDFIFWGSKITADGDCTHEIKRHLLLGRKVMTNLDSILESRGITLPTKVHLVKAMVFPVVMYGCESWMVKKAEHWRIDAFELWC